MKAVILDGRSHARKILEAARKSAALLRRKPGLAVLLAGEDPASHMYVNGKVKRAQENGFLAEATLLSAEVSETELLHIIQTLNEREEIDGILVQLPLPPHINALRAMAAIDPAKDVDGLHALNAGRLSQGDDALVPCTPLGCIRLIKTVIPDLTGRDTVVVGSSNIVGKPVAAMLLAERATVTQTHVHTRNLWSICKRADVLVVAAGKPGLIRGDWIKPGAIVIDVGTTRIVQPDGSVRTTGDVVFEEAAKVAGALTPVPGGVGPMTIACLMENTIKAAAARQAV